MPRIRETTSQYQAGNPIGAKTKIASTITISRKLVPQVGHQADGEDVADEDPGPHATLDQPEEEGRAELVLDQAGEPDRDDEEEADREQQREDDRQAPDPAADLFLL